MSVKEHIIDISENLFNRYGYGAVGVDQIRDEACISKTSLYRSFGSKNGLIKAILQQRHLNFIDSLSTYILENETQENRIKALLDWHFTWFKSDDFNGCMFMHALSEFKYSDDEITAIAIEHKTEIKQIILSNISEYDPERITKSEKIFTLLEGMIVRAEFQQTIDSKWYEEIVQTILNNQ